MEVQSSLMIGNYNPSFKDCCAPLEIESAKAKLRRLAAYRKKRSAAQA
jgi:hypothetical protein